MFCSYFIKYLVDVLNLNSLHSWDLDSFDFWVVVLILETLSIKCVLLHFVKIEGAYCVQIGLLAKSGKMLFGIVEVEHLLDAEVVLANIILVLKDTECSLDLILE